MALASGSEQFRVLKTSSEEIGLVNDTVPPSIKYKNKWALNIFAEWQSLREVKVPVLDCGGVFKDYELHKVCALSADIAAMDVLSLNYWLSKFVMELAKKSGERYPPKSVYGIICSLKRHLEERNGSEALNPLDASDKRYLTTFKSNCSEFYNELFQEFIFCVFFRFVLFKRCLDAEMKNGVREGLHIKFKKEEREFLSEEEEATFWEKKLLGTTSAKS